MPVIDVDGYCYYVDMSRERHVAHARIVTCADAIQLRCWFAVAAITLIWL